MEVLLNIDTIVDLFRVCINQQVEATVVGEAHPVNAATLIFLSLEF